MASERASSGAEAGRTRPDIFQNARNQPGRGLTTRLVWLTVSRAFCQTSLPWPYPVKRRFLSLFDARGGHGVVIKNRVNIKYPWRSVGDHSWIGEGAWSDFLESVTIGAHACLSQGCMIETGNHDWSEPSLDLMVEDAVVEDGAWAAVRSLLLSEGPLASHAVLGAGSVPRWSTEAYGLYVGGPALRVGERRIQP